MRRYAATLGLVVMLSACGPSAVAPTPAPTRSTKDAAIQAAAIATVTAIAAMFQPTATPSKAPAPPPAAPTTAPALPTVPPAVPTAQPAQPTASSAPLITEARTCEPNSIGDVVLSGRVRNVSQHTYTSIRVMGTAVAGSVKNDNWSYVKANQLGPGEASEFTIYVKDPNPNGETRCLFQIADYRLVR